MESSAATSPEFAVRRRPTLTPQEWLLVRLRDELYDGDWEEMKKDLERRLRGEPYIFKLVHRIQDDLGRIARLDGMERHGAFNLGECLTDRPT